MENLFPFKKINGLLPFFPPNNQQNLPFFYRNKVLGWHPNIQKQIESEQPGRRRGRALAPGVYWLGRPFLADPQVADDLV